MEIIDKRIDGGKAFDWGRTSEDYARFRDIYPKKFYDKIIERNLCIKGQKVLDLGTGTGVLPRNMYQYGAEWIGADISENQIEQARILSEQQNMNIRYIALPTEKITFPDHTFDVITACQCFVYFDHDVIAPKLAKMLKENGRLLILYMSWLPHEDEIAKKSEELVLRYNPKWSGAGATKHPIFIPEPVLEHFEIVSREEYNLMVPFTKETWNGRIKACRGIGASLSTNEIAEWEKEHLYLLDKIAPEEFEILHYGAIAELNARQ